MHWLAAFARLTLWLTVMLWVVVLAGWGLLHGWIVPRIGEFRPRLEAQATKALGVPVRIGQITAQSSGLIPSFELRDVALLDAQGRQAVRLPRVLVALSPTSVWSGGFEQLFLDQPTLDIRRAPDGKIYVGGLDMSQNRGNSNAASNWFFSQTEFSIKGGTVQWTDERTGAPPLALTQVEALMRNGHRSHDLRFDATPPVQWGERFTLRGMFKQPLLSTDAGRWQDWSGQVFAAFSRLDISQAKQHVNLASLDMDLKTGVGSVRAWADVQKGQLSAGTFDVALQAVNVRLGKTLKPLALQAVEGRFGGQLLAKGYVFKTEGLRFNTPDGLVWPGGNLAVKHAQADGAKAAQTEFKADKLDLAALAQIVDRLPLGTATHALMASFAPKGLFEKIDANWQGVIDTPESFVAKGRVSGLVLAGQPSNKFKFGAPAGTASVASNAPPAKPRELPGRPGISGATVDFDFNQSGGTAQVSINKGHLDLPGVFEDPRVLFDQLSMATQWKTSQGKIELQIRDAKFVNADAQGTAQATWQSVDPTLKGAEAEVHSLGVLDLQGVLNRGNGSKVHRYLPLVLAERVRHYVRDAVLQGSLSDVQFKVKGPVDFIPFSDPAKGEFKISTKIKSGTFAYVPKGIQAVGVLAWPALTDLNGELVFNRAALEVNGATGKVAGLPALQVTKVDAQISDLLHGATVNLKAIIKGPLSDALTFVNNSPLGTMTSGALGRTVANGVGDYALNLSLPLSSIDKTRVQGTVTLPGNDVQFTPSTPQLGRLKGAVTFNETGFNVSQAQARMLGGEIRFDGGTRPAARSQPAGTPAANASMVNDVEPGVVFKGQGSLSADGLRQAKDLGLAARLAQNATGTTSYAISLGFKRGTSELVVSSNLQGLALSLPAPLNKSAEALLPVRFENSLLRESMVPGQKLQDQLSLTVGRAASPTAIASVLYTRDVSGAEPRVIKGSIGVGLEPGESAPTPSAGVAANINLNNVNLDAWQKVLANTVSAVSDPASNGRATLATASQDYLPSQIAIRAKELTLDGRKLNNVVVGGTREGPTWRANVDATELNGYLEFRSPSAGASNAAASSAGRVYARLSRLSLGQSTANEVETLLDEQPANIPSLDIVVDDLELRGKKLGRVEIEAVNRGAASVAREGGVREWRLNKLNLVMPEALFSATGNWVIVNAQGAAPLPLSSAALGTSPRRTGADRRRTVMNFKLDIADSGLLLKRFGMADVVRLGKGKMDGQIAWAGSPLSVDYPSMSGQLNVNIEGGQFLKADPGLAKLMGVLSLQSLPRRLALDFRDVFTEGFAFDFVRGDVNINQGVAFTNNLQMKGVNAAVLMEGSANIAKETQDIKVVVVPEINAGTASLIATVINPAIGLGTFLAQYFLRQPLIRANTQEFHIDGSWADPKITKVERKP